MLRLLRMDGVTFPNNQHLTFTRLEPLTGGDSGLHAEGRWTPDGTEDVELCEFNDDPDGEATVAVAFGPQYGPVTAKQVEELIRPASRRYEDLVIAGFSFDGPDDNGEYTVTMEGVDIYNPVDNSITPTNADKVAAWFLDSDYDGRTFCVCQAFFPDKSAWNKLARALKDVLEEDAFEAFAGTVSLPFPAGKHETIAVKVIDPRGNEVMRVEALD